MKNKHLCLVAVLTCQFPQRHKEMCGSQRQEAAVQQTNCLGKHSVVWLLKLMGVENS